MKFGICQALLNLKIRRIQALETKDSFLSGLRAKRKEKRQPRSEPSKKETERSQRQAARGCAELIRAWGVKGHTLSRSLSSVSSGSRAHKTFQPPSPNPRMPGG